MKYLLLNGAIVGHKTRHLLDGFHEQLKSHLTEADSSQIIDLKDQDMVFSDGRHWADYSGDTLNVLQAIMAADVIILSTPTYQASLPAPLKNIFDLLPEAAFYHKTVGFLVTAGSEKHYLVMAQQLIPILDFMKANVLTHYVFAHDADFNGSQLVSDDIEMRLAQFAEEVTGHAEAYQHLLVAQDAKYDF